MEEPIDSSVPNPQSGRNAKREDETKREESIQIQQQQQQQQLSKQLSPNDGGSGGSLSGPIDNVEAILVDPIQSMYIGGPVDPTRQGFTPPGKLFVGGVSGKTTTASFTEYFEKVSFMPIFTAFFVIFED